MLLALSLVGALSSCAAEKRSIVLTLERPTSSPRDAAVYIDERFVGLLGVVSRRGIRLPEGEHRVTVERTGYFPWDALIVSTGEPVHLRVELVEVPD